MGKRKLTGIRLKEGRGGEKGEQKKGDKWRDGRSNDGFRKIQQGKEE